MIAWQGQNTPLSIEQTQQLLQDYMSWDIVTNTAESVIEALVIEQRYNISFRDALIVQAAQTSGAAISIPRIWRTASSTLPFVSSIP
jgi:predicted nucleic acid-binding protein